MVGNESLVLIALKKARQDFMAVEALLTVLKQSTNSNIPSIDNTDPSSHDN